MAAICDHNPNAFPDTPLFPKAIRPAPFLPVKELVIINLVQSFYDDNAYAAAIAKLARSQYTRGMPFERMEPHTTVPPLVMDEMAAFCQHGGMVYMMLLDEGESWVRCGGRRPTYCTTVRLYRTMCHSLLRLVRVLYVGYRSRANNSPCKSQHRICARIERHG
jgi:hypothetical protein